MGNFDEAVAFVLENEGGFVDNPKDPGGATNHGISLRLLRMLPVETLKKCGIFHEGSELTPEHIRELTQDQAKLVYKFIFWEAVAFEKLENQKMCNYVFDMAVLHGVNQAIKLVQRALWTFYLEREAYGITDDGLLGEKTLSEINSVIAEYTLVLTGERAGYVRLICELDPQKKEFLNGWLDRCYRW